MATHPGLEPAPRSVSHRRYMPLQDKVFLLSALLLVCGLLAILSACRLWYESLVETQDAALAKHLLTTQAERHVDLSRLDPRCREALSCRAMLDGMEVVVISDPAMPGTGHAVALETIETVRGALPPFPSPLALSLVCGILLSLAIRQVLYHYLFRGLDLMQRVVFARRVFALTGGMAQDASGREFDGRFHFFRIGRGRLRVWLDEVAEFLAGTSDRRSKLQQRQRKSIKIVSRPVPPRIPLDRFSNDELGQLAAALDESHNREGKWQNLLQDLIESMPLPVAALSRDGRIVHVNRKFLERTSATPSRSDEEAQALDAQLRQRFHFPPDLADHVLRILDQTHPRIVAREFQFQIREHPETIAVSVSTVSKLGKRLAIIVLHEFHAVRQRRMGEVVAGLASRQIDLIQSIADEALRPSPLTQLSTLRKCEILKDHVNTLFDFIQQDMDQSSVDIIEFNLHALLHSLRESAAHTQPFLLSIEGDVPIHVYGNPMHLRQFTLAVLTEYFSKNHALPRIQVTCRPESGEVLFSLQSSQQDVTLIGSPTHLTFLQQLAASYRFHLRSFGLVEQGEFFSFSFRALEAAPQRQRFRWLDMQTPLKDKCLIVCVGEPMADAETLDICRRIPSRHLEVVTESSLGERLLSGVDFDAAVVLPAAGHWQRNSEVARTVGQLRRRAIPALLIPPTPRRGDAAEAQRAGFSAYLRSPVSNRELESLLQILCNKDALSDLLPHGLITRHMIQDLADEFGSCLVADVAPGSRTAAEALEKTLLDLALKVVRKTRRGDFFEALYSERFSHVFYPARLPQGFRRQLAMGIRGKTAICFSVDEDMAAQNPEVIVIRDPANPDEVLEALRNAERSQPIVEIEDDLKEAG